jgi:hypothetical protein
MKVSMKCWKIGVYFGSIALAVGIGMFQVGKEGGTIGSRANCVHNVTSNECPTRICGTYDTCTTVESGGADSCSTTAGGTRCFSAGTTNCISLVQQKNHAGLTYQECVSE